MNRLMGQIPVAKASKTEQRRRHIQSPKIPIFCYNFVLVIFIVTNKVLLLHEVSLLIMAAVINQLEPVRTFLFTLEDMDFRYRISWDKKVVKRNILLMHYVRSQIFILPPCASNIY